MITFQVLCFKHLTHCDSFEHRFEYRYLEEA